MRPADYDDHLVARVLGLGDGSMFDLYGRLTVFYHAADRGNWVWAQRLLDEVVRGEAALVPMSRDVWRCE